MTVQVSDSNGGSDSETVTITVRDATPPVFVSSDLDAGTGVLSITFSEDIDATPKTEVDTSKIHIRESGTYTGGVTLTAAELDTNTDGTTISFTLTASHNATVAGLTTLELTIEPGAVSDTAGNPIMSTFDVSTASFVDAFNVSAQDSTPTGMAFSSNGIKMFVVGWFDEDINEYNLTSPWDVSTATFVDAFDVSAQDTKPRGMAFSSNGTKMFVVGNDGDDINEYNLTSPWDVSTATFVDAFDVSAQDNTPTGMAFSSNGTKMFVVGNDGDDINEYNLTSPWDVSTATFVDATSVSAQDFILSGMAFSSNGTKMFVVGEFYNNINEYNLTSPWDVSTATFVDAFDVSAQETSPTGMAFSSNGTKMFVVGDDGDDINEYTLSSVYPIMAAVPNQSPTVSITGAATINESASGTLTGTADDPDGTISTYAWSVDNTSAVTITSGNTATLQYTASQVSSDTQVTFTLTVTDNDGAPASATYDVTVNNVPVPNQPPTVSITGAATINESASGTLTGTADDPDGTISTYAWSVDNTSAVTITSGNTATLQYTASQVSSDTQVTFTLTVTDNDGAPASATYDVTVNNVPVPNQPPLDSTPPSVVSILRNTPLAESTTATTLVFAVTFDEPVTNVDAADFTVTGTGTGSISGVTGTDTSYTVTVTVTDVGTIGLDIAPGHDIKDAADNDLTDLAPTDNDETYTVTVVDNTPPRIASILRHTPLTESTSDTTLVFAVTFDESVINVDDATDFTVTGTGTGTISGVSGDGASYRVTVTVTASGTIGLDIASGHDIQDAANNGLTDTAVVGSNEAYLVNQLPVLNNIPSQTGDELTPLTFTAEATDPDNHPLTYSLIEPIPDGATMDANTGVFSWTPTETQDGIHTITVQVSDGNGGGGGTDLQDVQITVTEVNQNPVLDSIGGQTIDETDTLEFDATARDDDIYQGSPNSLTFSLGDGADRPRGTSITRDGSFSWRPDQSQDGVYSINVTVSDGQGGTASELVSVTINDIAPRHVSVRGSGSSITLAFSESVNTRGTDSNGFTVSSSSSGNTVTVESITGSGTDTLTLLLDGPLSRGDMLSYDSSTGDIVDESGKPLESFVDAAIILLESKKSGTAPPSVDTLEINGQSYNAQNRVNHNATPLEVVVDQPISMSFTAHDRLDILYFAVYLNLQDDDTLYTNSDTYVEYNRGQTNIVDPQNLLSDASLTVSTDPDDSTEKTVTLDITFADAIGNTNMVIRTWNADHKSSIVIIVDALNVIPVEVDPEPQVTVVDPEPRLPAVPSPELGTETFADDFDYDRALLVLRMWSGFESEIADDGQLLAVMGLSYLGADIPAWVMTDLAPLVVKELITLDEFRVALEYVMGNT